MYSPTGAPVDIVLPKPLKGGESLGIELTYSGTISSIVNNVNLISEHLTEIALYCSWFPLMEESRGFSYSLAATLPQDHVCVTDGDLIDKVVAESNTVWHFRRESPGYDIPLIASDQFKVKALQTPEIDASLYYFELDDQVAEAYLADAVRAAEFFGDRFGDPTRKGRMIFVNSHRDGWGYSRVPLFVVSENYAQRQLNTEEGRAGRMHGNAHEIAHFWWSLTDAVTTHNWIDEALAEYSSLLAMEHFYGRERVNEILAKYKQDILTIKDSKPILQTLRNENTAYVLFYEKGAMIFAMLGEMLGRDKLLHILRTFHTEHNSGDDVTTTDLLELFKREAGLNLDPFFEQFLGSNALPILSLGWENTADGVKGQVLLDQSTMPEFPLELSFYRVEKRILRIHPGENAFEFELPFEPDLVRVDENHKLLTEKTVIKKAGEAKHEVK